MNKRLSDGFGGDSILFKIVPIFIGVVFVLILSYFIGIAVIGIKVVQNPEAVAEGIGSFIKTLKDSSGF